MSGQNDKERRRKLMEFRENKYGQAQVTGVSICVFSQAPCIGSVCEQYDPWGEQCGIRSVGMAASAFMEAYSLSPMEAEDGPAEPLLETEEKVEADASTSVEPRGGERENVAEVGVQQGEATGPKEPGDAGTDGEGETG